MEKFFFKFFIIFILLFSFEISASEINLDYLDYEKLDEEVKEKIDYIPSEYIVYYDTSKFDNMLSRRSLYTLYSATPSTYDLRSVNGKRLIPPMEDQGSLGLCWAFASNNVLESYYLKNNKGTIDLSDDQPSYVSVYLGDTEYGAGNSAYNTLRYWLMGYSPVSEELFGEYSISKKSVTYKDYLNNENLLFDIKNVKVFPALNTSGLFSKYTISTALSVVDEYNKDIKNHIMNYGALFTGIFWDFYDEDNNLIYNDGTLSYESYALSGHAVTIIGWDDNYEGVTINGTAVKGAWIAMNSWGENTEYFYISYYDADVVKSLFGVTSVEEKSWNNSYADYELFSENGTKKIYEFKKGTNTEKIESVKLLYKQSDTTAKVYISDGINTYTSTSSTEITYGIKTYEFDDVSFDSEKIYVIVDSSYASKYFEVALFTSDALDDKILEFEDLEFNRFLDNAGSYNLYSKNIDTGSSVTIKVYDQNGNDISSKFSINKPVIINDYANITLNSKSSLSDYEYIRINASVDGISTNLINYINGDGTQENPYIIRTPYEMTLLTNDNIYLKLGDDIDLENEISSVYGLFYNEGYGWEPLNFVDSHLDGNGYTIMNLTSKLGGLFLEMDNSILKNIKLENFNINSIGENSSSSIVAVEFDNNSEVKNVYIDNANITSSSAPTGGIIGFMYDGVLSDIHIKDSNFSSDVGLGLITFNITNPRNSIIIKNIFSKNTKINCSACGLVSAYLNVSSTVDSLKPIDIEYNIFNYNEDVSLIASENINITDDDEYDIYENELNILDNVIKKDSEIFNYSVFNNYDMTNTWSFDTKNSAYLLLFEDEFDNLLVLNNYSLQDNLIYQVDSETKTNDFVSDIINISDLNYKVYSSGGVELQEDENVTTGSYIDVSNEYKSKRYYIVVTGDANGDGILSVFDIVKINNHIIDSNKKLEGMYNLAADYNQDGELSIFDIVKINNAIIGGSN